MTVHASSATATPVALIGDGAVSIKIDRGTGVGVAESHVEAMPRTRGLPPSPHLLDVISMPSPSVPGRAVGMERTGRRGKDCQCGEQASNLHGPMPPSFKPGASASSAIAACYESRVDHRLLPVACAASGAAAVSRSRRDAIAHGAQRQLNGVPLMSCNTATGRPTSITRSQTV